MENVGLWILLKNAPQLHRGALGTDTQSKETWLLLAVWLALNTLWTTTQYEVVMKYSQQLDQSSYPSLNLGFITY